MNEPEQAAGSTTGTAQGTGSPAGPSALVVVDAGVCGHAATIKAVKTSGYNVRLELESDCPHVQKIAAEPVEGIGVNGAEPGIAFLYGEGLRIGIVDHDTLSGIDVVVGDEAFQFSHFVVGMPDFDKEVGDIVLVFFIFSFCCLWMCLGGWLAIAPTTTTTFFGPKNQPNNYGIVFSAYGIGAIAGNLLSGYVKDTFVDHLVNGKLVKANVHPEAYMMIFYVTLVLALIGMAVAFIALKAPKTKEEKTDG